MIASELFTLNISKVGSTLTRLNLKVFETLRSNCVMRSLKNACGGCSATVSVVWFMIADGPMIWPAGHGAGQLAGYRVVPRVKVMLAVVALVVGGDGWLLWNDALNRMPYGSG